MKWLTYIILLLILTTIITAYEWEENSIKMDTDFANGGIQEINDSYNTSTIIGSTSLNPFISNTDSNASIGQGIYYIIWSDLSMAETIALSFLCDWNKIDDTWAEINCSANQPVYWNFSISDKITLYNMPIYDPRENGTKLFTGLGENRVYNVTANATNSINSRVTKYYELNLNTNLWIYLYVSMLILFFLFLWLGYKLDNEVFATISGMIMIIISISLFNNGLPGITNNFLKNSIVAVLAGIGMFFIVVPYLNKIEDF